MTDLSMLLKQMLGGGGAPATLPSAAGGGPAPIPQPPPGVVPPQTAAQGPAVEEKSGFDWRTLLNDVTAGMAQPLDYRSTPFNAIAQGYQGALASETARNDKARKTGFEDQDRATRADDRSYNRRITEGRAGRAEGRADRSATRADESHELGRIKSIADIMRSMGGGLTTDQRLKMEKSVTDFGKALAQSGALGEAEIQAEMDKYRTQLEGRISGGGAPAPSGGVPAQAPTAQAQGTGTQSDPFKINTKKALDALPSGAIYLHPTTQQLRQKN